jgi:hypothetical protein
LPEETIACPIRAPYKNGGVDGTDIGADIDAIAAATGLPL